MGAIVKFTSFYMVRCLKTEGTSALLFSPAGPPKSSTNLITGTTPASSCTSGSHHQPREEKVRFPKLGTDVKWQPFVFAIDLHEISI